MATITTIPFIRHMQGTETTYLRHLAKGAVRHEGAGASFWFRPLHAAISEVPVDDREQEALVTLRTADLQVAAVPTTVTYRFADPALAAARVDFGLDLRHGRWHSAPLERVGAMLHGAASAAVLTATNGMTLAQLLTLDAERLRSTVRTALAADDRLTSIGVAVIAVRFGLVRPEPDVEKALQTPAREAIQQEADKATFERRALAVEREAAIGENELASRIELARRTESLIEQQGANQRREAQESAQADAIAAAAEAARMTELAQARARSRELTGEAEVAAERSRIAAYEQASAAVLQAMAIREMATALPKIDQLVLTPDVLTGALSRLTGGTSQAYTATGAESGAESSSAQGGS